MNLFGKHKKFEDQLKEQLGDMEFKPSASLWDRIDSDITKDGFETDMQSSLENFEQVPYSDTWDKIAAELPEERIGNSLFKYYGWGALSLLFAVGVWVGYEWNKQGETLMATTESPKRAQETPDHEKNITIATEKDLPEVTSNTTQSLPATQQSDAVVSETAPAAAIEYNGPEDTHINPTPTFTKAAQPQPKSRPATTAPQTREPELVAENRVIQVPVAPVQQHLAMDDNSDVTAKPSATDEIAVVTKQEPSTPATTIDARVVSTDAPPVAVTQSDAREVSANGMQPDSVTAKAIPTLAGPKAEELTRFSISILAGAHMSYMNYAKPSDPQFNFDQNIALRKQLERPDLDWSGGFLIDYRISNKWMLSTGLMMVNFNQQFHYDTLQPTVPVNPNETFGAVYESTDSVITGNGYSNRIKYSWTEIPLFINYNVHRGQRWDIDLQAGVGYAFVSTVDAGMVGQDNKGVFALKDKSAFPQIKNSVFVSVMPQISYKFGQNVSVGFVPTFKYSATSMIGNERWVQQHPYFVGVNLCLRKRF
ncbi:MAG: hypothetical protein V4590_04930 [Bacteroidota bacterium]